MFTIFRVKVTPQTQGSNGRSRSAHFLPQEEKRKTSLPSERAQSKEDKNKQNTLTANNYSRKGGYTSDNPPVTHDTSGRDSVDQYLEVIQRFRGNHPQVYNRPLQKNVNVSNNQGPKYAMMNRPKPPMEVMQQQQQQQSVVQKQFQQPPPPKDPQSRAETLGFVKANKENEHVGNKKTDMDYQEYMNIVNKVRRTKEFTRVRAEQIRLASMYAQEKKRQDELKLEEERLHREREKIERERQEAQGNNSGLPIMGYDSNRGMELEKGELDNKESELLKFSPLRNTSPDAKKIQQPQSQNIFEASQAHNLEQQKISQENARLEQLRQQQMEQKRQQELRELQVKAEQEKLLRLREEQIKQEKEREEIRRLEYERLQQIQEEQQKLEMERRRQEETIRLEQQRLEEERRKQERLQAERNALYNRQRLDMEAKNFTDMGANQRMMMRERIYKSEPDNRVIT